jgi:hypothetical protein
VPKGVFSFFYGMSVTFLELKEESFFEKKLRERWRNISIINRLMKSFQLFKLVL